MDKLPSTFFPQSGPVEGPDCAPLSTHEIRLIVEGKTQRLSDFAASFRLHAADAKGDTPLHLAARLGNLAICDLFIRSGANPLAVNFDRHTPADVAFAEGHVVVGQQLLSLTLALIEPSKSNVYFEKGAETRVEPFDTYPSSSTEIVQDITQNTEWLDNEIIESFDAESEPEEYFEKHSGKDASGHFFVLESSSPRKSVDEDADWDLDLTSIQISGDGIGSNTAQTKVHNAENGFLKVGNRGRQSKKRSVIQTGTRLWIDPEICITWAQETFAKGRCLIEDVDRLIADCEGNGEIEELRSNIERNLEDAGFDMDVPVGLEAGFMEAKSN